MLANLYGGDSNSSASMLKQSDSSFAGDRSS